MRQKRRSSAEATERKVCWCGEGFLETVEINGVEYLHCDACGGELGK